VEIHSQLTKKTMKKIIISLMFLLSILSFNSSAQTTTENHGNTLNLGLGIGGYSGYYGYIGRSLPIIHLDYEFDVENNFTLAPFLNFYSFKNEYYWGDNNHPYKNYIYRETVIPVGIKGTFYFDQLLKANSKWDFYLAGSLGFAIVKTSWDSDYYGDENYYRNGNSLFLDLHLGAEYHVNSDLGIFLDLSSGVSTLGIAIR